MPTFAINKDLSVAQKEFKLTETARTQVRTLNHYLLTNISSL